MNNNPIFSKRIVSMVCALYLVHFYQKQRTGIEEKESLEQLTEEKEEVLKRQEQLHQLIIKPRNDSLDDLTTLLENLEEVILAFKYIREEKWFLDQDISQGYVIAATCLKGLLTSKDEDLGKILEGPYQKLCKQLTRFPSSFSKRIEEIFKTEAKEAIRSTRQKRLTQLLKAGIVLKRALPESPMIAISSLLSIYSGTIDSTRLYLRGEVLTRAIMFATNGAGREDKETPQTFLNLFLLEILAMIVSILKEQSQAIGKRQFVQHLKSDLFAALLTQDIVYFEKNDLYEVRHLIGNCDYVCTSLLSTPTSTLESIARVISSGWLLTQQSPTLSLFIFAFALPVKSWINSILDSLGERIEFARGSLFIPSKSFNDIWQTLVDPRALKTMRAFAREPIEISEFSKSSRAKDSQDQSSAFAYQLITPARDIIDKLLDAFGVWYGGKLVGNNEMRAADLPSFVSLCSDTFDRARFIYGSLGAFGEEVLDPVERMHDLLTSQPKIERKLAKYDQKYSKEEDEQNFSSIEFTNVHFAYPTNPDTEILKGVSFRIERGERIGIMGESGCGKSTIFALLEMFYEPSAGKIRLGGKLLKEYHPLYLRERIAWVSQQSFMAKRTIKENLMYGRRDRSNHCKDEEIEHVLNLCNCAFFLNDPSRFPDGLLTVIGPNASKLSGGEVQRLALARALLSDPAPQILLLDEYTSALDETSQRNVQLAMNEIWERSNRKLTILSIAHRISNFKNVERVMAMSKHGVVAEIGAPKELLSKYPNGIFSTFVKTSEVDFE